MLLVQGPHLETHRLVAVPSCPCERQREKLKLRGGGGGHLPEATQLDTDRACKPKPVDPGTH